MTTSVEQVWAWLEEVPDPEIPAISVVDLGIVRAVELDGAQCTVTITPTYSGCPAMQVIADAIETGLKSHGIAHPAIKTQLSPAWTTDWMSVEGKNKLRAYGIAPPAQQVIDISRITGSVARSKIAEPQVACPHCGSGKTRCSSHFGSTPCKALYRCDDCLEPFDYFKCH
ncbi:MAG: phenylacetate-CoA oxygenase subunit PaaJ [Collimonas sp.]